MVEVMKMMVTSFRRSHAWFLHSMPPTLHQPTSDPCLCQRHLDTHGQVWVSLLWGHCSFLLCPGTHNLLFVPSKNLFPKSCVSSGDSKPGLMANSSKRAYATPRSTAPRAPAPAAVHYWPIAPQETLKDSSVSVSVESLGPGMPKVCLSPLTSLTGMVLDSKCDFAPAIILVGLLLWPWCGVSLQSCSTATQPQLQNCTATTPAPTIFLVFSALECGVSPHSHSSTMQVLPQHCTATTPHRLLWLCGLQQTVENSSRNGNTRPCDLPPEKSVCRSRSNS